MEESDRCALSSSTNTNSLRKENHHQKSGKKEIKGLSGFAKQRLERRRVDGTVNHGKLYNHGY